MEQNWFINLFKQQDRRVDTQHDILQMPGFGMMASSDFVVTFKFSVGDLFDE